MALDPVSAIFEVGSKVLDRLLPDPAQQAAAKLELLKLQESGELAKMANETKLVELEHANTNSARDMNAKIQESASAAWLAKNTAYALDIGIVASTILLAWFAFMKEVPEANKQLVYMALGSLITMCGTVLNFHRGSSQGSKDKNAEILKLKDMK